MALLGVGVPLAQSRYRLSIAVSRSAASSTARYRRTAEPPLIRRPPPCYPPIDRDEMVVSMGRSLPRRPLLGATIDLRQAGP